MMSIPKLLRIIPITAFVALSNLYCSYTEYDTESEYGYSQVVTASPCYTLNTFISALFLKPSSSNLHYAVEAIPLPAPSPNWNVFDICQKYHAAFDVGVGVILHQTDTALTLNWERYRSSNSAAVNVSSDNMIGPFFEIGPDALPYKEAAGRVSFSFDEVNLDYGKLVHFGEDLHARLFGGISFVSIKQNRCSIFSNEDHTIVRNIGVPSSFKGAGPQFGVEGSYCIIDELHLTGKALVSLLAGRIKNNTTYTSFSPALTTPEINVVPPNVQHTCVQNGFQIVPAFEEKIGLSYAKTICSDRMVQIGAGYQVQVYLNALQSVDLSSEVVTPPVTPDTVGVFARTFHGTISNFALAGPYISLDVAF